MRVKYRRDGTKTNRAGQGRAGRTKGHAYIHRERPTEQNRTENRTEQNRTEQNRTEQNRTEQNRGDTKKRMDAGKANDRDRSYE